MTAKDFFFFLRVSSLLEREDETNRTLNWYLCDVFLKMLTKFSYYIVVLILDFSV